MKNESTCFLSPEADSFVFPNGGRGHNHNVHNPQAATALGGR